MKSSVIIFPGSNCDRDIAVALKKFSFKNKMVWHNESFLPKSDLVVLPGGFSYGDYLRCGSIAAKSKIINEIIKHVNKGGLVLGVCNGFQILLETGLLKGTLLKNKNLRFISKNVYLKIINKNNVFVKNIKKDILEFHIAHNEGNYFIDGESLREIEDLNLIAFKYCDDKGNVNELNNPNGSIKNIAGIFNNRKNVLGIMPHPERMIDKMLSGEDGSLFFKSLFKSLNK